ncbi:Ppx/GppA phosphatase family protein [Enteractinococcus fodinae]|uniref:Exopolyphosphatase/guanosine-5'-triphosphate, 3'-diphosphate pyrophosphatase n=1 Tax=Enteractinococcus fodinae TaxID=684663 RepID=A0ABU2AY94_9MICC|nr:Ppx/GppA family phosphatase [Enteractinococcus fodinae]MDR7346318.1 exopolyphosphatase/guanosine-5'-triphosphate,3'-diphosphate pyrophosphatase [Enteractinococcus fodinae]
MRLGVLDIGSNTVHLLLVDAFPGARPTAYADHKRPMSLIQHLDGDGAIAESGQRNLVEFINSAVAFAKANGAADMISFCTSAIRDAANGTEVLARITKETGVHLTVLSGDQEAAMTYFAVRRWHGWHVENLLNFDIGGGSFEMSYGTDELPTTAISVPLGAQRLTREFFTEPDPPTSEQLAALNDYIHAVLKEHRRMFPKKLPENTVVTGTSKTFRSLARLAGAAPSTDGLFIPRKLRRRDLTMWNQTMALMTEEQRAQLPGVSDMRARQVLAGGMVAQAAMEVFKIKKLRICPWALREGLILGRLDALRLQGQVEETNERWVEGVDLTSDENRPGFSLGVAGG